MDAEALFENYKKWYQETYLRELIEEDEDDEEAMEELAENGWVEPLAGLTPVTQADIDKAQAVTGALPATYRELLLKVGAGTLLCANEEEPTEQEILHPDRFSEERQALLSWLSDGGIQRIKNDQGIDVSRLIPILKPNETCWVVLAGQSDGDDRTFVFDHDFEGGYDRLLCGPEPLDSFLEDYFQRVMLKNPLNGFNCWESPQEG